MHLLAREIGLAVVGVVVASAVQVTTPLTAQMKQIFMGLIFVATAFAMARVGGLI